jgi:hypothetical protein
MTWNRICAVVGLVLLAIVGGVGTLSAHGVESYVAPEVRDQEQEANVRFLEGASASAALGPFEETPECGRPTPEPEEECDECEETPEPTPEPEEECDECEETPEPTPEPEEECDECEETPEPTEDVTSTPTEECTVCAETPEPTSTPTATHTAALDPTSTPTPTPEPTATSQPVEGQAQAPTATPKPPDTPSPTAAPADTPEPTPAFFPETGGGRDPTGLSVIVALQALTFVVLASVCWRGWQSRHHSA